MTHKQDPQAPMSEFQEKLGELLLPFHRGKCRALYISHESLQLDNCTCVLQEAKQGITRLVDELIIDTPDSHGFTNTHKDLRDAQRKALYGEQQ